MDSNMEYKSVKMYESDAMSILSGACLAEVMNLSNIEDPSNKTDDTKITVNLQELTVSDVLMCSCCSVTFVDNVEQRNHYKLDWHRYNIKRALLGKEPVSEDLFLSVAVDISSISGSDTETSSVSSGDDDNEHYALQNISKSENIHHNIKRIRHTKIFFENENNELFSVYRCLLQGKKEVLSKDELVNNVCNIIKEPKRWLVVMLGGGHFASAIFENGNLLHHKTFHSYTVRAKQGGSQSARDNKGGGHPKSAGASLRRYNEQTLIQHVQEIMSAWAEPVKHCSLILYRATGPWNRSVLFGGKNPPLCKTDKRLRNIPFPTKRATFKEVKRVYDMLSSVEIYGCADNFKDKFPKSPDKRNSQSPKTKVESTNTNEENMKKNDVSDNATFDHSKNLRKKKNSCKKNLPLSKSKELNDSNRYESSSDDEEKEEEEVDFVWDECVIDLNQLKEFDDDVPQSLKDLKKNQSEKKKKKRINSRQKAKEKAWDQTYFRTQRTLVDNCKNKNKEGFIEALNVYNDLPDRDSYEIEQNKKPNHVFTKEDFMECLNAAIDDEDENTVLHLAAVERLPEFVTLLLDAGADPTVRNKQKQTPYFLAGDKKTKASFRAFVAQFPDKFDLKKANIPPPPTEEMEKHREEKKKEKRKLKQARDKIKKQENKQKREEDKEKAKFLALSDREKCALAAERRLLASLTANVKSAKTPVLSRCFQCGCDMTGRVPFEYGTNRFCSMPCLKAHRAKTKSYGVEI